MKERSSQTATDAERKMDYHRTSDVVRGFFAWKPGLVSSVLIKALSVFMRPLEQGTYGGKRLSGEPHRASWVIASPLTVFVLPEAGYWRRVALAARLRSTGPVNIIAEEQTGPRARGARKSSRDRRKGSPRKGRGRRSAKPELEIPEHHNTSGVDCDYALESLITIQNESEVSLTVVPVVQAYHQLTPDAPAATMAARAYRYTPLPLLRKATNWSRTVRTGRVKNCRPQVLSKWLEDRTEPDLCSRAAALRVDLMSNIESERRACTGPPLPPPWEVRRRVLADPMLAAYMQEFALREGLTREAVLDRARGYIEEIQSTYRVGVTRYVVRVVDYLFDKFLEDLEVDREGIRFLAECDSRSRIVMVCNHKSYADSLMIGYVMFRSGMVPPQQAAGQNMTFWPMGWLLRHCGAFYIRRTFMGETLYKEVFCAYVRYLLADNYTSVVYIEGTRSRDGKMAKPKVGYLGILEDALRMGVCPDITLVPVYLGFDKMPEEAAHVKEMAGSRKVSESMTLFARMISSIKTSLGKGYVKFGTPMSFKALLDNYGLRGTAEIACDEINKITVVTARSLAGCALLAPGTNWVSVSEFDNAVNDLLNYCERRRLPVATDADFEGIVAAVDLYAEEGYVAREERQGEDGIRVEGYGRRFLEYNKNIQLAHFLEPSLAAIVSRRSGSKHESDEDVSPEESMSFLQELFSEEFVFSPGRADEAWKLDHQAYSTVLCSLLESYLECYYVACRAVGSLSTEKPVSIDEAVELCFSEGERMLKKSEITREESLSRIAFKNAVKCYGKMGLLDEVQQRDEGGNEETLLVPGPRFIDCRATEERIHSFFG